MTGRPDEDAIRERAYQIWQEGGGAHGDHDADWRRAEAEIAGAAGIVAPPPGGADLAGGPHHLDGGSHLPAQDEPDGTGPRPTSPEGR